jgi:hypothetical protein
MARLDHNTSVFPVSRATLIAWHAISLLKPTGRYCNSNEVFVQSMLLPDCPTLKR